jgi:nucleoside-diphosphate-sugar epimerase
VRSTSELEPEYSVFGASGFIGSALVSHLRKKGRRVRAIGREDEDALELRVPLQHAIFAIGVTADFRSRPFDTVDAHVTQINRLLRQGDFLSLTYLSSTRVYEGNASTSEASPVVVKPSEPSALYNISKIAGESICLTCGRPNVRVARLSNVVGPGSDQQSFIDQILQEGLARGTIELRTHPESVKDYIALEDVLNLIELISAEGQDGIYNVASGEQTSHRQVTETIAREAGWSAEFDLSAPRTVFPQIDIARVKNEFGFTPKMFGAYFPSHVRAFLLAAKGQQ